MKTTHASLLVIASLIMSQAAFSFPVTREIWNCKGDGKGNVSSLTATSQTEAGTATGSLLDRSMSSQAISLSMDRPEYELGGVIEAGHDRREYKVLLLPDNAYDYLPTSDSTKTTGTAYVYYSGFVDCVGDVSTTESLSCDVQLER